MVCEGLNKASTSPLRGFLRRLWRGRAAYGFVLPAYLFFGLFMLVPLLQGIYLSFFDAGLKGREFVGLENFRHLAQDESFHRAVVNTFLFVLGVVPLGLALSLGIAVLVYPLGKGWQTFFRLAFYLPVVASAVVLSMVWLWIFNPSYGLLNALLKPFLPALTWLQGQLSRLGVENVSWLNWPIPWLGQTETALLSLGLVVLSWTLGQPVILFLAALGSIPPELHEAARIDGASDWQQFWRITLPLLRPTTLFVLVTQTIGVFQVFVVVLMMTQGGPFYATETIVHRIYQVAFNAYQFGYASAMAVVLAAIVGVVALLQFKFLGQEVEF